MTAPRPTGWPIWGHEHAVDHLRQAILRDRIGHAFLVAGPEATGKTALATALAQTLLCQEPPAPAIPCGSCLACRKIARGVHPDVQTFALARQAATSGSKGTKNTTLTIETVREITATSGLRPMEGRWRVTIVDDAESLQPVAQEALLKTLEEPPSFLILILLSNDAELLLPTIRSRCQLVELRPVARAAIRDGLVQTGVKPDRADEIAALAAGLPGWARRVAEQPKLMDQRQQAIARAADWVAAEPYDRLIRAVQLGDAFSNKRAETFADLDTVLGVWRDALLHRAGQSHYSTFRGQQDRLADLAREWPLDAVHRAVRSVQTGIADLEANVRPRLALEAMVLQWPIARPSSPW